MKKIKNASSDAWSRRTPKQKTIDIESVGLYVSLFVFRRQDLDEPLKQTKSFYVTQRGGHASEDRDRFDRRSAAGADHRG